MYECTNELCSQVNTCLAIILKHKEYEHQILVYLVIKPYNPPSESLRSLHFANLQSGFQPFGAVEPGSKQRSEQPLQTTHCLTVLNRTWGDWSNLTSKSRSSELLQPPQGWSLGSQNTMLRVFAFSAHTLGMSAKASRRCSAKTYKRSFSSKQK